MSAPLRILVLEDRETDALLAIEELRGAGFTFEWERVETERAFRAELEAQPDLILADYTLPQFDGLRALRIVKERGLDTPFILISGSIGEDLAVAAMLEGADDYLLKDRLARLAPAVLRVLEQKRVRSEKRQAEQALHESEKRFRALIENSSDIINLIGADGLILYASPSLTRVLGYEPEAYVGHSALEFVHPADMDLVSQAASLRLKEPGAIYTFVSRLRHKDGSWRWLEGISLNLLDEPGVHAIVATFRDITERKQAETIMLARVRLIEIAESKPIGDLLQATLDEAEAVTSSQIGFFHFLEADQITLSLQKWSTRTLNEFCSADAQEPHYPVDQAGVWVDCVRERRPVIHNDYATLPHRKGTPEGHTEVKRELVVPVMRGERIMAVLGVGNKPQDYTQSDVEMVSQLADLAWDTVERKRAVEALRDSEARFRNLFEGVPIGLYRTREQGQILDANEALVRMLGYPERDTLLTVNVVDLYVDDRDRVYEQELVKRDGVVRNFEIRIRRYDGTIIWVENNVRLIHDPAGRTLYYEGSLQDITDRKMHVRELMAIASVSAALRAAPTQAVMLPIIVDQTRNLLETDGIALTLRHPDTHEIIVALARGEWTDRTGARLSHDEGVSGRVIATGQPYLNNDARYDPLFLWRDFHGDVQAVACVPLIEQQQTIGALMIGRRSTGAIFTDNDLRLLTLIGEIAANALYRAEVLETLEERIAARTHELSEANEQLRELDRLKSKFVSDVSHELRTPVANLNLYVQLLEQGKPEKFAAYITTLKQQASRLTHLVESILDLSRLERRKENVTFALLDLNPIVDQVVTAHLPRAEAAEVQLTFEPDVNLPPVWGEANQLAQVMTNLVANALNYTPAGRVQVTTRQVNHQVCFQVADTGIGIPPEDMPHLFERFYRGQSVGQSDIPGTGLGLAIVKEIVDSHQGRMEVESEAGVGTIFRVWLPIAEPDGQPQTVTLAKVEYVQSSGFPPARE